MSRLRPAVAAACLAASLSVALPTPGSASRDAEQAAQSATCERPANSLFGSVLGWGQSAVAWLQALVAAEHGYIVQVAPPPPPPDPEPES